MSKTDVHLRVSVQESELVFISPRARQAAMKHGLKNCYWRPGDDYSNPEHYIYSAAKPIVKKVALLLKKLYPMFIIKMDY